MNDEGIDVVLHLLDQLHSVRRVLAELQADGRDRATPRRPASPEDAG